MFFEYWPILFVDDEPDVLAISKLAMKNFQVYGLPVKIAKDLPRPHELPSNNRD